MCLSFSNFLYDWPSIDPDLSTAPYDQKDLCVFCRTYTFVESLTTKTAGPLKRPSSSTIASLHDVTGSFASCYKSHRLSTCLWPLLHYVVLLHDFSVSFKVFPLLSRNFLLAVVLWHHPLVMILWLNSQWNRFPQCKQAREATYRCQRLKANIQCVQKKWAPLNILHWQVQTCPVLNKIKHALAQKYLSYCRQILYDSIIPFNRFSIFTNCCHRFQLPTWLAYYARHTPLTSHMTSFCW